MIFLLGRCPPGTLPDDDPALHAFEEAVALLEQYYHPSNGGKWTGGLALFLRESAAMLCHRLVAESGAGRGSGPKPDLDLDYDSEEESEEEEESDEDSDGDESDDSGYCEEDSEDEEAAAAVAAAGTLAVTSASPIAPGARRPVTQETARRVVTALVRLASKGQSSKDGHMKRYSSVALSQMAFICPDIVLPFIYRHFITALDTVTAARQYGNAIQALSLCVRPLLLAGLPSGAHIGGGGGSMGDEQMEESLDDMRAAAAQAVASAMMATLPGIDANDPPKSLAVFRLYCSVLSSIGELPVSRSLVALL